ncbi:hypothetical protein [Actinophytocola sp.]|uniref:hypothetical protein n=1 Tax=Actinophytocola sp. TaxID=1872138 RepID=UPI002ED14BB3
MNETEVDGVPVLWADAPGPLTGTIVFGVGARDESFRTIGITHLVEHLAMSTLPRVHYEHNAAVDLDTTEFYAAGKPQHVVEFLAAVCTALAELPLDRIEKEAGVLAAEGGHVTHPTAAILLNRRFGANGPGLALWEGPGYDRLSAEQVTEHVQKFFTRANAVVTLTGPPPEGLRLPLPDGERPVRVAPQLVDAGHANWAAEPSPAPGLALLGPARDAGAVLAMDVLRERLMETARREQGISYDVDGAHVDHDTTRADRLIWLDAREGQEAQAATILWQTAQDLATNGPTAEELAFAVEGLRHMFDDPRAPFGELENAAYARLFGFPYRTSAELLANAEQVLPAQIAATLTESLRTALLTVPEDVELDLGLPLGGCPRTDTVPPGREFRPPRLARLVNKQARAARLILSDSGVAIVDGDGDVHHVAFTEVVGVRSEEDGRILFGRRGCVVPVLRSLFGGVEPVIEAVDRAVAAELHYAPSEFATND